MDVPAELILEFGRELAAHCKRENAAQGLSNTVVAAAGAEASSLPQMCGVLCAELARVPKAQRGPLVQRLLASARRGTKESATAVQLVHAALDYLFCPALQTLESSAPSLGSVNALNLMGAMLEVHGADLAGHGQAQLSDATVEPSVMSAKTAVHACISLLLELAMALKADDGPARRLPRKQWSNTGLSEWVQISSFSLLGEGITTQDEHINRRALVTLTVSSGSALRRHIAAALCAA